MKTRYITIIPVLWLAVTLAASCGRDGGTTTTTAAPPVVPTTVLSGMASKGPISGATIKVYAINSGLADMSTAIGTGQTADGGSYSIELGAYEGPILVEVTGGTFTDEASGATVALKIQLHAIIADVKINAATTAAVTPMTELAYKKAKGSGPLTTNSINDANASIALAFNLKDIISTLPVRGGETDDQKMYAAACGAFSQLVNNNKKDGESLEDALERLLGKMGDEEENDGKLSPDFAGLINEAISSSNTGTTNDTGTTTSTNIVTLPTSTMGVLKLATVGIPFAMASLDVTIAMPLGVTVDFDRLTGETAPGVVTISGVADFGNNNLVVGKFTPAFFVTPALLHIVLLNPNGFGLGEFATVQFNVVPGEILPLTNSFIPVNFFAKGITGLGLIGVAAVPLSVEGI
jgi:hypothetical protein